MPTAQGQHWRELSAAKGQINLPEVNIKGKSTVMIAQRFAITLAKWGKSQITSHVTIQILYH
ncbi:hypothetical protein OSCI_3530004 [Kamptonema sp. PCC 6506]|nr:hypothetical protein OSCI_3530004 [Kamptonema sp. PCC 6506]